MEVISQRRRREQRERKHTKHIQEVRDDAVYKSYAAFAPPSYRLSSVGSKSDTHVNANTIAATELETESEDLEGVT